MSRLLVVPERPRRALIYVRVSDEGGRGVDLLSPQIQTAACRDYCQRNGYEVVEVVEDIDLSGRTWRRRQVEAAVQRIERGEVEVIVVWKWSRFARNRRDWAVSVDRIEVMGGTLESATEPADATSSGRFARGVLAELAAFESERIGDGWRETHRARFEAGLPPHGRHAPWCMRSAGREVVVDEARAAVMRQLYARYLAGAGFGTLAAWLRETGQPTTRGATWDASVVAAMMDSPMHAGLVSYQGERRPGSFEAVVDADTFARYEATRRDRRRAGRRAASPFLLSGLGRCGECGYYLVATGGYTDPRYRCAQAAKNHTHEALSIAAHKLDAEVLAWLADLAGQLDELVDGEPGPAPDPADRLALEATVTDLDRKLARLTEHLLSGLVTEVAYRPALAELTARREAAEAALQAAADRATLASAAPVTAACDLLAEWDTLPVVARRAALRALIRHVTVWTRPALRVEVVPAW